MADTLLYRDDGNSTDNPITGLPLEWGGSSEGVNWLNSTTYSDYQRTGSVLVGLTGASSLTYVDATSKGDVSILFVLTNFHYRTGVVARFVNASDDGLVFDGSDSNLHRIYKLISGTLAEIGSGTVAYSNGTTRELRVEGVAGSGTVKGFQGGTEFSSTLIPTGIADTGKVGISDLANVSLHSLDWVEFYEIPSAGPTGIAVLRRRIEGE